MSLGTLGKVMCLVLVVEAVRSGEVSGDSAWMVGFLHATMGLVQWRAS